MTPYALHSGGNFPQAYDHLEEIPSTHFHLLSLGQAFFHRLGSPSFASRQRCFFVTASRYLTSSGSLAGCLDKIPSLPVDLFCFASFCMFRPSLSVRKKVVQKTSARKKNGLQSTNGLQKSAKHINHQQSSTLFAETWQSL